jgi:hypothetical protein
MEKTMEMTQLLGSKIYAQLSPASLNLTKAP